VWAACAAPLSAVLRAGGDEWAGRADSSACGGGPWQFAVRHEMPQSTARGVGAEMILCLDSGPDGALQLSWSYDAVLFEEAAARCWTERLRRVLRAAAASPELPLQQVPSIDSWEVSTVVAFAGKQRPFRDEPLHVSFLQQAAATPDALAVFEGSKKWTYADLARSAQTVAADVVRTVGSSVHSQEEWLVGLVFERSLDVVAVIYGVLIAGAGYLPMDPDFPTARIEEILLDAGHVCPLVLVGSESLALKLPWSYAGRVACATSAGLSLPKGDAPWGTPTSAESVSTTPAPGNAGLAYCMYTSGTTGKPKGVMVGHRGLAMRISWFQAAFKLGEAHCVPFKTPYIFGISEWELFWPLTVGAHVAVVPQATVRSVKSFSQLLEAAGCTHACFVPSHLGALLRHWNSADGQVGLHLRHVIACGEVLSAETATAFAHVMPHASLHNLYGPTEGSMTWRTCQPDDPPRADVLIGRPIDNTFVFLLDRWQKLVPVGVPGEIHFGHCVAQGYLNRPELTSERFVQNPLSPTLSAVHASPVLYRTGDLASWLPSGELRYIGRADRQVKVRGYRIELGAVEAAMRSSEPAASAVVAIALPPSPECPGGDLVGYLEIAVAASAAPEELRRRLSEQLPSYMVPSRFLYRTAFPQLPSGKPDLRALAREAAVGRAVEAPAGAMIQLGSTPGVEAAPQLDSLGMARRLAASGNDAVMEARISDNMRAFLMYGVILDHWAGCSDTGMCNLVVEGMIWKQATALQPSLLWIEYFIRAIGNYKDMSGFIMVSAYNDSAYADAGYFSKSDLVVFVTYLQFMWVLDPLIWVMCRASSPQWCTDEVNYFAGVHRWYLLVMLGIKVILVLFRLLRIPPLLQCMLVTVLGFLMPSEVMCLEEEKCAAVNDPTFWRSNFRSLDPLWNLLFRGGSADIFNMSTSAVMRYYVLFAAQYLWAFHYGRPFVSCFCRWCGRGRGQVLQRLQNAAPVVLLAMELASVGVLGPVIYNYMQEDVLGTLEPQLLPLLLLLLGLAAEVALLALAASRLRRRLRLLGSTTLGCYMIHMYFTYPVMLLRPSFDSIGDLGPGGFALQLAILLAAPLLFQLTVGAAFHKLLMLEFRALFAAYAWLRARLARPRGKKGPFRA